MSLLTSIMVGVLFTAGMYLMLGRELKGVCMGVFLLGHAANLAIIATSRAPANLRTPVLQEGTDLALHADPLPQALILTAIVIGFAVQAFLLTLLVVTWRRNRTLSIAELAQEPPHAAH